MTNPYNWGFPKRNETMFLATICIFKYIQSPRPPLPITCASPPSRPKISLGHNPNSRFSNKSRRKITLTLRISSQSPLPI